jgi:hypothetical protein
MATAFNVVFFPFRRPEEKKEARVSNKVTPELVAVLSRFTIETENAVKRQLSPGDVGLGRPDDGNDDDGNDDDMIDRAKNHLDAIDDEDSVEPSTERLAAAHELLSRVLAKRRGKSSPHSIHFARG